MNKNKNEWIIYKGKFVCCVPKRTKAEGEKEKLYGILMDNYVFKIALRLQKQFMGNFKSI